MFDEHFQRAPLNRSERITYVVSLMVILGLFLAEIFLNYEPRKLAALIFIVSWGVLVAVHEFGHAIMAWICGWGVRRIVIGFGRPLYQFHIGKTPVELRTFPIEGFVQPYPRDLHAPRAKDALIYAAGPGIELILAFMLMVLIGKDTMFTLSNHLGILSVQAFALAAVTGALLNLIPMTVTSGDHQVPNDGMGILLALRRTDGDYTSLFGGNSDDPES